jgi:hypothetical protein
VGFDSLEECRNSSLVSFRMDDLFLEMQVSGTTSRALTSDEEVELSEVLFPCSIISLWYCDVPCAVMCTQFTYF